MVQILRDSTAAVEGQQVKMENDRSKETNRRSIALGVWCIGPS